MLQPSPLVAYFRSGWSSFQKFCDAPFPPLRGGEEEKKRRRRKRKRRGGRVFQIIALLIRVITNVLMGDEPGETEGVLSERDRVEVARPHVTLEQL